MRFFEYLFFLGAAASLHGNPTLPKVISGNVSIDPLEKGNLTIQSNSDRSIIEWDSFSIDQFENTTFQMSTIDSVILNRVTGGLPSTILGNISSNGIVYLVNSAGIEIGSDSVIETNGFLASTLDASDTEFIQSNVIVFFGSSGGNVVHSGIITAFNGDIIFFGNGVLNLGKNSVSKGRVVSIGTGQEIVLDSLGISTFTVAIPPLSSSTH